MAGKGRDFWLGPILVEPDKLRLSLDERIVILQPRVMDVLVALASARDTVVSRRELEALVWTDAHVGYHALPRAVYEARKVLEKLSPGSAFLETVPRRGYRLKIASVPVVARRASEQLSPAAWPTLKPQLLRRLPIAAIGLLMLGLVMHAASLHGTAVHYTCAASILAWTIWPAPQGDAVGSAKPGDWTCGALAPITGHCFPTFERQAHRFEGSRAKPNSIAYGH